MKTTKTATLFLIIFLLIEIPILLTQIQPVKAEITLALEVQGNKIELSNGTQIILKGMVEGYFTSVFGMFMDNNGVEYIPNNIWTPDFIQETLNFAKASGCNLIPIYLCAQFWLEDTNNYRSHIEYFAQQCANRGIYNELTFFQSNATGSEPQNCLPWDDSNNVINSSDDFVGLWGNVSTTFNDYPNVIFHLWNEPQGDMATWMNISQQCIDRIRSVEATQPICIMYGTGIAYDMNVSGWIDQNANLWGYNMSSWFYSYPLTDSENNLIYATHIYRYSFGNSSVVEDESKFNGNGYGGYEELYTYNDLVTALTNTDLFKVSQSVPVIVDEMGYDTYAWDLDNETTWYNNTLTLFDQNEIGYCGWSLPPNDWGQWHGMSVWSLIERPIDAYWGLSPNSDEEGFDTYFSNIINYSLNDAGTILVNHMNGISYSDYLTLLNPSSPAPTDALVLSPFLKSVSGTGLNALSLLAIVPIITIAVLIIGIFMMICKDEEMQFDWKTIITAIILVVTVEIIIIVGVLIISNFQNTVTTFG